MIINDEQLRNTQRKLESLEAHYRERERDSPSPARDLSLQSLRRTINELTEEIVRYGASHNRPGKAVDPKSVRGEPEEHSAIRNESELENARVKLKRLEQLYEAARSRNPSHARDATLVSLKRTINQFKEEIAVFQAHHPAASRAASS